ncbi:hypothetical protein HUN41_00235 [Streptomyces phage Coruscant]|uniref:Uncharacterized protein n=1 Tax=Streptomyces phage Coruscant TaxID=2739834 RepID=A0A7G4AWD4_9CAUD|nr:hypothetical protein PP454_gp093 [Streptomyces phage Coruscant]QMP84324.1 hypothetical protein HUN41_00235 [Streptomyces phage Coruscant]
MGFWSDAKDLKNVVAFENSPHRDKIQEWDLLDQTAQAWKSWFERYAREAKMPLIKCDINVGEVIDEALTLTNHSMPATKYSGGCCTTRAVELFNRYGGGGGVPYEAAVREGYNLALGKKSKYPTKSKPRGCAQ